MKNGDLIIEGIRADQFVPENCVDSDELLHFEMNSYAALDKKHGAGYCERNGIDFLQDIYGQEFSDRVYKCRSRLIAQHYLVLQLEERAKIDAFIERLRECVLNPPTDISSVLGRQ